MKKIFTGMLVAISLASSMLALTEEQRKEFNEDFEMRIDVAKKTGVGKEGGEEWAQKRITELKKEKAQIEAEGDEAIERYLRVNKIENVLMDIFLGSLGVYQEISFKNDEKLSKFGGFFLTIGPRYNLQGEGAFDKGFSISLPIGLGMIERNRKSYFAMPVAIEGRYSLGGLMPAIGAGLRYTFSPMNIGTLHMMDVYASLDIYWGFFMQIGYIFFSSQEVSFGRVKQTVQPYTGQTKMSIGWRF